MLYLPGMLCKIHEDKSSRHSGKLSSSWFPKVKNPAFGKFQVPIILWPCISGHSIKKQYEDYWLHLIQSVIRAEDWKVIIWKSLLVPSQLRSQKERLFPKWDLIYLYIYLTDFIWKTTSTGEKTYPKVDDVPGTSILLQCSFANLLFLDNIAYIALEKLTQKIKSGMGKYMQ